MSEFESYSLGALELEFRRQIYNKEVAKILGELISKRQVEAISLVAATGETVAEARTTLIHHGWDVEKAIQHLKRNKRNCESSSPY